MIQKGTKIALLTEGHMLPFAMQAAEKLKQKNIIPLVVNMRFLKPLDTQILQEAAKCCDYIVTVEDGVRQGGFGTKVLEYYSDCGIYGVKVWNMGFPDKYIEQGTTEELYHEYQLDGEGIYQSIINKMELERNCK